MIYLYINTTYSYNNIMNEVINLRIHIAPMGFEVDRIVIPAKEQRADRLWLLTTEMSNQVGPFKEMITEQLQAHNIEVKEMIHDRSDPFDIIRATRQIIQQEDGNNIAVNLSSGSKIQAVGCMLACMMFNHNRNVSSYYAEPKKYSQSVDGPLSEGVQRIMTMPGYDIQIPDKMLVSVLHIIQERGRINKKDLLRKMQDAGLVVIYEELDSSIKQDNNVILIQAKRGVETVAGLTRLNNKIITPLLKWGFIDVEQVGRNNYITLTSKGKNAIKFLPKL